MPDYHDLPAISQSFLKAYDRDPAKAVGQYIEKTIPRDPPTASMLWGIQCEQFLWGDDLVEIPRDVLNKQGHRKGDMWRDFAAEHDGKTLLKPEEMECFKQVRERVREHAEAESILFDAAGVSWRDLQWHDDEFDLDCKGQIDRLSKTRSGVPVLGDLKTAVKVDADFFAKQSANLGYHRQAAWYGQGWQALTGETFEFVFVVVQNSPSYQVEVYVLDEDFVQLGYRQNRETLERYVRGRDAGQHVSRTHGTIVEVSAPRWAMYRDEYSLE